MMQMFDLVPLDGMSPMRVTPDEYLAMKPKKQLIQGGIAVFLIKPDGVQRFVKVPEALMTLHT